MIRRNTLLFIIVLIIFTLAAFVGCVLEKGITEEETRSALDLQGGTRIIYKADLSAIQEAEWDSTIDGAIAVLENRINPLGVSEVSIRKLGSDEILVELPGRSLTDKEIESLSRVALLEFGELTTDNETVKWEAEYWDRDIGTVILGKWKPATAIINGEEKALTSRYFKTNTQVGRDELGGIELHFEWDKEGSQLSEEITERLIGQPLAIFDGDKPLLGETGILIAPYVESAISDRGVITGLSLNDATRLSRQLNAGHLPVPLQVLEVIRVPLK